MKIKKVDDKPMVIHTKQKAKIHRHAPKTSAIKGANVYTINRSPTVKKVSTKDGVFSGMRSAIGKSNEKDIRRKVLMMKLVYLKRRLQQSKMDEKERQ